MSPGLRVTAPEAMGLMEFGWEPMFTFPLTEEAKDERAPLHTDTYPLHTCTATDKCFTCTRVDKLLL